MNEGIILMSPLHFGLTTLQGSTREFSGMFQKALADFESNTQAIGLVSFQNQAGQDILQINSDSFLLNEAQKNEVEFLAATSCLGKIAEQLLAKGKPELMSNIMMETDRPEVMRQVRSFFETRNQKFRSFTLSTPPSGTIQ
jgi:hypothetical protein